MWYFYTISITKVLKNRYSKIVWVVMGVYSGWDFNLIYLIKYKVVYDSVYILYYIYYIIFYHPINWSCYNTVGTISSLQIFFYKKSYKIINLTWIWSYRVNPSGSMCLLVMFFVITGEDIVFLATDINLPGAVDWVMMQSCFGHHFMLVLEKQEKFDGHQQFFAIVQLIGSRKQAENFAYR